MCTVVCRFEPGTPLRILALRDEFVGRESDGPGAWWPEQPDVIGGRDRVAGGTWCASDVRTGVSAVVLNRPDKHEADPGGASRGVLPLLAVRHRRAWTEHVDVAPMAAFNLLLATPDALAWWTYDGVSIVHTELAEGTHLAKPHGLVELFDARLAEPDQWRVLLEESEPRDDSSGLLVRAEHGDRVYATVFGQIIEQVPGELRVEYTPTPQDSTTFTTERWSAVPGQQDGTDGEHDQGDRAGRLEHG